MQSVRLDRARAEDAAEILRLLEQRELPLAGLIDHLATVIVAREAARIVGTAALEVYPDGALLRSVAVDPAVQGRGVGRRLTQAAMDLARERSVQTLYLLTTTAEAFFPKFGFSRITRDAVPPGVRQSVEFGSACPSTAVVMCKHLP